MSRLSNEKSTQAFGALSYKAITAGKTKMNDQQANRKCSLMRVGGNGVGGRRSKQQQTQEEKSSRHLVLSEEELATFRTSFCTKHHQNKCPNSDSCEKSHCLTWQRRNPYEISYCPQLCPEIQFVKKSRKMVLYRRCTRGKSCNFAHSKEEELYHPLVYKTKQCSAYPKCSRYFCPFVHDPSEMRNVSHLKQAGASLTLPPSSKPNATVVDEQSISPNNHRTPDIRPRVPDEQERLATTLQDESGGGFASNDFGDTLKSSLVESQVGLWYEPPSLSAICAYDDVTVKSLYGFSRPQVDEYIPELDLQSWQSYHAPGIYDTSNNGTLQGGQGMTYAGSNCLDPNLDGHYDGLQFVQYVPYGKQLEDGFANLQIKQTEDLAFNDLICKFMGDLDQK